MLAHHGDVIGVQHFGGHQPIERSGICIARPKEIAEFRLLINHHLQESLCGDRPVLALEDRDRSLQKLVVEPRLFIFRPAINAIGVAPFHLVVVEAAKRILDMLIEEVFVAA